MAAGSTPPQSPTRVAEKAFQQARSPDPFEGRKKRKKKTLATSTAAASATAAAVSAAATGSGSDEGTGGETPRA